MGHIRSRVYKYNHIKLMKDKLIACGVVFMQFYSHVGCHHGCVLTEMIVLCIGCVGLYSRRQLAHEVV